MALDPRDDLKRLEPYAADIRQAAAEHGVPAALLAGVALRESWAGWALSPKGTHVGWGDRGYGFGLFQVDSRTWEPAIRGFMPGVDLLTPLGQARAAAAHLASGHRILRLAFPALSEDSLWRAAVASYNARLGAVAMQLVAGADVDAVTTAGPSGRPDYSADVFAIAARVHNRDPERFPVNPPRSDP